VGLPVLICDTDKIKGSDDLEIDLASGIIKDLTNGARLTSGKIPDVMLKILDEGGLVPYIKKYGDFRV
jgi:3-isopropylmalate/(R)-2-methylmalate dehydratase small subunit